CLSPPAGRSAGLSSTAPRQDEVRACAARVPELCSYQLRPATVSTETLGIRSPGVPARHCEFELLPVWVVAGVVGTLTGSIPGNEYVCEPELPYRCDYQIVVSAATPRNFVSWLTSGTSSESAVAATRRSAGSPGKGSPRPPARSATTSVTG